jgi:hypothetical protein
MSYLLSPQEQDKAYYGDNMEGVEGIALAQLRKIRDEMKTYTCEIEGDALYGYILIPPNVMEELEKECE